jgi:hypothetical protein
MRGNQQRRDWQTAHGTLEAVASQDNGTEQVLIHPHFGHYFFIEPFHILPFDRVRLARLAVGEVRAVPQGGLSSSLGHGMSSFSASYSSSLN